MVRSFLIGACALFSFLMLVLAVVVAWCALGDTSDNIAARFAALALVLASILSAFAFANGAQTLALERANR